MYIGFSAAMFSLKQTLILHLFPGTNNALLLFGRALCLTF
jgi:hypothetical protein